VLGVRLLPLVTQNKVLSVDFPNSEKSAKLIGAWTSHGGTTAYDRRVVAAASWVALNWFFEKGENVMPDDRDERGKAIEAALAQIDKQFGKGSIMRLGSREKIDVPAIPTGALSLDAALGVGGMPRGRVVEIYGPESSGKTTLALHVIAEAQKRGGMAAFVDAEHALDAAYAAKLGVDTDNLLVSQPDSGEQALEIAEVLIRSGAVDVLVIDSVAALVPRSELEGEMGEAQMGLQARLMSQALRKLTSIVAKSKTCLIFINQLREKIGVMFGSPETTTGGRALKFYASIRLDIRRIATLKEGEDAIGSRAKVKVVKNKVAAPFREAEFDILYGEGISKEGDLLDLAVEENVIEKSGAWYAYQGERMGQGRENARQFLKDNKDIRAKIDLQMRKTLGLPFVEAPVPAKSEKADVLPMPEKKKA
jgi:recombination protein RecA